MALPVAYETAEFRRQTLRSARPVKRPRANPRKNLWVEISKELDTKDGKGGTGWSPRSRPYREFVKRFHVQPLVVQQLVAVSKNLTSWKSHTRYHNGDLVLMAVESLRGKTNADLVVEFGGGESTVHKALKAAFKLIEKFDFVFRAGMPNAAEQEEIKKRFEEAGVTAPGIVLVGDCKELPIWSTDDELYTHKQNCASHHAIRVRTNVSKFADATKKNMILCESTKK